MPLFKHDDADYQRNLEFFKYYKEDALWYLNKMTGRSLDDCRNFIENVLNHLVRDPEITILKRNEFGDRHKTKFTLSRYIHEVASKDLIMSPSMIVYLPSRIKKTLLVNYIDTNIKKRKKAKAEMFKAEREGNVDLTTYKDLEQLKNKISNNALSGLQAQLSSVLGNKTAHSSLTSTCRTSTSYGNANTEKMISGNRHYWSYEVTLANVITLARQANKTLISDCIKRYQLHCPTPEETLACIRHSSDIYWVNKKQLDSLHALLMRLDPEERCAIVYTGDLYHLRQYNDSLLRHFIDQLSTPAQSPHPNAEQLLSSIDGGLMMLVMLLNDDKVKGRDIQLIKEKDPYTYGIIAQTAQHCLTIIDHYQVLINTFFKTPIMPSSIAHIRGMVRKTVVTSDTDSTIFTTAEWVEWMLGKITYSPKAQAISDVMVYLVSQTVKHILAQLATQMGVEVPLRKELVMKSEFNYPLYSLSPLAKHYYALKGSREGLVYSKPKLELKGKNFLDINLPMVLMEDLKETIYATLEDVTRDKPINLHQLYAKIAQYEVQIDQAIKRGDVNYLSVSTINSPESYDNPFSKIYMYHDLWVKVFSQKYGESPPLPYDAVMIPVNLGSKTKMKQWLDTIEDQALSQRFKQWLVITHKESLDNIALPREYVIQNQFPSEIPPIIISRQLIYHSLKPWYLFLESLGVYTVNDQLTRLISDTFKPSF